VILIGVFFLRRLVVVDPPGSPDLGFFYWAFERDESDLLLHRTKDEKEKLMLLIYRKLLFVAAAATLILSALAAQAESFLVASDYFSAMRKVDPINGAIIGTMDGGTSAGEIDFGSDGLIYASYFESYAIREIDPFTGQYVKTVSLPGKPRDVTFGPDGKLYIALTGDGSGNGSLGIYQYDISSQQLNQFNASTFNGIPIGIAFGPDNDLFVCLDARYNGDGTHTVVRLDGQTGISEGIFTDVNISIPQSLAFRPNGNLYVGNQGTGSVTEYAPDGSYLDTLISNAGNTQGLYFLPDGDLLFGQGGSDFVRYDFSSHTLSTFSTGYAFSVSMILVPEPSTLALLLTAAIGGLLWRRRRA
jgi:streptogramin lyase